jgi:hypothetical protein
MPELTKVQTGFLEPQGPFKLDTGTAGTPGVYFEGDETTGFYRTAEDEIGVSIDGTQKYNFTSEGLSFNGTSLDGTPFVGKIDKSISDTAVDIFIYDTSKDSDGGAWRQRTSHTSWYNETLNTATRGSRREFPSVAVIVAEGDTLTIYDGDDPDLPMWMKFTTTGTVTANAIVRNSGYNISTVSMINGLLTTGVNLNGMFEINFISDKCHRRNPTAYFFGGNIVSRNGGMNFITISSAVIVNTYINDVAMTVLPNAPIDSATGLPIPTIAVATDGGGSVIKDDETVASFGSGNSPDAKLFKRISIDLVEGIYVTNNFGAIVHLNIPNTSYINYTSVPGYFELRRESGEYPSSISTISGDTVKISNEIFGSSSGLSYFDRNLSNKNNSNISYITSTYNTGWMHGDIKGTFLSDTDATNVTGTELVTNGTFSNTNASSVSNWDNVSVGTGTISEGSGYASLNRVDGGNTGRIGQGMNLISGKSYFLSFDIVAGSTSGVQLRQYNSSTQGLSGVTRNFSGSTARTESFFFTCESGYDGFLLIPIDNTNTTCRIDNFSVRAADPDRSANNNPLQVFGTVTKSAVATGAELVGYSGFSNSTNYLSQPSNSDLAIGNSDFSCVGWFKKSTSSNTGIIIFASDGNDQVFDVRVHTDMKMLAQITDDGFTTREIVSTQGPTVNDNIWHQFHVVRRSNILYSYLDGNLLGTSATVEANITNPMGITIGAENLTASQKAFEGSLSLIRFSRSAPSPEQIKKIYEDEKVLLQENAACTLYGSSDAVTALAYDEVTERLHVGTSSGRSEFQGLRRINNTTTAVTTAISAYDSFVVEQ